MIILTPIERKLLLRYRDYRSQAPTIVGLLIPFVPVAAISACAVALSYYVLPNQTTLFVVGLFTGIMMRNVALVFHAARVMPGLLQVIDWEKVDRMLEEEDHFS